MDSAISILGQFKDSKISTLGLPPSTIGSNQPSQNFYQHFIDELNLLTQDASPGNIDLSQVSQLFYQNLRWINSQTGNKKPDIQDKLFFLSERISKEFNSPQANRLAFQIQATAKGLYSDNPGDWNAIPEDVKHLIFSNIVGSQALPKSIVSCEVSKSMQKTVSNFISGWIKTNPVSLKELGCKNVADGIEYVKKNQLIRADFTGFPDFNDEDLKNLVENCPNLLHLSIPSSKITEEKLFEALEMLTKLESLNLSGCYQIKGEKLFEALKMLLNLRSLNLSKCPQITEKMLSEALETLPNKDMKIIR